MTEALVDRAVPLLTHAAKSLSDDLR
jgi:hypothetical protein